MLEIVSSYHCMQFQVNLMNQTWENDKKHNFGPHLCSFCPNLGPKSFFRGFYLYWILDIVASYHCMHPTIRKWRKTSIWACLGLLNPNLCCFLKNLASSVTRYHGQLSSCTISEGTNDPILRKLSDRRMDRRREWFHRTLSN